MEIFVVLILGCSVSVLQAYQMIFPTKRPLPFMAEVGFVNNKNCASYFTLDACRQIDYRGRKAVTESGAKCLPWTSAPAAYRDEYNSDYHRRTFGIEKNYCRSPDIITGSISYPPIAIDGRGVEFSSIYNYKNFNDPKALFDGDKNTQFSTNCLLTTTKEDWIMIKLYSEKRINKIAITPRQYWSAAEKGLELRASNVDVLFGFGGTWTVKCNTGNLAGIQRVVIPCQGKAYAVKLRRRRTGGKLGTCLEMAEFEVLVRKDPISYPPIAIDGRGVEVSSVYNYAKFNDLKALFDGDKSSQFSTNCLLTTTREDWIMIKLYSVKRIYKIAITPRQYWSAAEKGLELRASNVDVSFGFGGTWTVKCNTGNLAGIQRVVIPCEGEADGVKLSRRRTGGKLGTCLEMAEFEVLVKKDTTRATPKGPWCYTKRGSGPQMEYCNVFDGSLYRGTVHHTSGVKSGGVQKMCMKWKDVEKYANSHWATRKTFPESGLVNNYCRNPNGHKTIWCYFWENGKVAWDYCVDPRYFRTKN